MNLNRLEQILNHAASRRITVIGDLMLDEFVWGKVGRISPEAPVPVVEVTGESFYPGGAANVARNLREFIDHVSVIGMLGKDRSGRHLRELLTAQNIDTSNAVEDRKLLHNRQNSYHCSPPTGGSRRSRKDRRPVGSTDSKGNRCGSKQYSRNRRNHF